jgi:hypothetical protein
MQLLKLSTAATVVVGPVLDADGVAVTTAVAADFSIAKNGTVAAFSSETITHSTNGYYTIGLTSSNTNTLGRLDILVNNSAMAMSNHRYDILPADTYEELLTTGIADAVYEEPYAGHDTPGTYGFLWDKWRKSNPSITGEVTSAITPTTTQFSTDITGYSDGAFENAVLIFINGSTNADFRGVVSAYLQSNGVVTITPALPQAPVAGDEFTIPVSSFVYTLAQSQAGLATTTQLTTVEGKIDGVKAKTDNLPADPASSSDITSLQNNSPTEAY